MSESAKFITMREPKIETKASVCFRKGHASVVMICLLCSVVYLYLYSNLTFRTLAVSDMMEETINDIQKWKVKVEKWIRGYSKNETSHSPDGRLPLNSSKSSTLYVQSQKSLVESTLKTTSVTISDISTTSDEVYKSLHNIKSLEEQITILKEAIVNKKAFPLITLFTTWPTKKEKFLVHNNTVKNWRELRPFVQPVLFTDEPDLESVVKSEGWDVLPVIKTAIGIPILKHMYTQAAAKFKSKFLGYSNGDILFSDGLIKTLLAILNSELYSETPMMIVGQRTNVQDVKADEALTKNVERAAKRGKLFTVWGEDYFITTPNYPWKESAEVVIGKRAYDNWLVLNARKRQHVTIDVTNTLLALHQTTKAGNHEGHGGPNSNYNDRLLGRLFKRVNYAGGLTSCTQYYTQLNSNRDPEILKRTVHKSCFPL